MVKHVEVRILEGSGSLKAFADVLIEPGILIRGCMVLNEKKGVFALMPRKLSRDGRWSDVIVIENAELKAEIEQAIMAEYSATLAADGKAVRP